MDKYYVEFELNCTIWTSEVCFVLDEARARASELEAALPEADSVRVINAQHEEV